MAKLPWTPWHKVVTLRDDLLKGELVAQMFARTCTRFSCARGKMPVYEKAENFFALTFPTLATCGNWSRRALRCGREQERQGGAAARIDLRRRQDGNTLIATQPPWPITRFAADLPRVARVQGSHGERSLPRARVAGMCFGQAGCRKRDGSPRPGRQDPPASHPLERAGVSTGGRRWVEGAARRSEGRGARDGTGRDTLTELLELPGKGKVAVLVLMDEC